MTRARILILLPLLMAAPACKRSEPAAQTQAAPQRTPDRLMARQSDQRERADTTGAERVTCKKEVPSIPCAP